MSGELLARGRPFHYHYDDLPPIPASGGHFEQGAVARCSCGKWFVSQVKISALGSETAWWRPSFWARWLPRHAASVT